MKYLIVANWKMNPSTGKEAVNLFNSVKKGVKTVKNAEVVICPPFVYIPLLGRLSSKALKVGGQNVFYKESGAFTGEISPLMLKDLKVKYVIVGHSEARKFLDETDIMVNKKIKEILQVNLRPILCVGEKAEEINQKSKILKRQIIKALKNVSRRLVKKLIIAYEPVWAIGTGKNCSVGMTLNSALLIRKIISKLYDNKLADKMKILYGGSVNSKNSKGYLKKTAINGLLVGGDSLDVKDFVKIIKSAS